jgi:predicted PurR-regulated permease PerM
MEETVREGGVAAVNAVLVSSLALIDFIVILAITPVVAFYLLLDWDAAVAKIDGWLPRRHAPTIRRLASEIDLVLAGFLRGQLLVCLILGVFYAFALMAIRLPYGFLVGLTAGLVSFIPYVGTFFGGALAIGIALFSFWGDPGWILATIGIFAFGQFVEGNFLTPKLIGASVGLHPVWLIFALAVFGSLFGFAGLLIAVPVAAALGVLGRFAVEQYLASPMYTGDPPPPGAP